MTHNRSYTDAKLSWYCQERVSHHHFCFRINRRWKTEPASGAGEITIPSLVCKATASSPRLLFTKVVEIVCRFSIKTQAKVVPKLTLYLLKSKNKLKYVFCF